MRGVVDDLRQAGRSLSRSRGFTVVAMATISLGIGLSTAVFTVVDAVLLRPLPFPRPEQLVAISSAPVARPGELGTVSLNDLEDWRRASRTVEAFGAWRDWSFRMRSSAGSESVYAVITTPDLFRALPVTPILGRVFSEEDDRPGRNRVVLLSEAFWRTRFGGDPRIINQTVTLERAPLGDLPFTIAGVLPAAFDLPSFEGVKIWAPSSYDVDAGLRRNLRNRQVFARLRDGVTLDEAAAELRTLAAGLAQQYPDTNAGWTTSVVPLIDREVGPIGSVLVAFLGAVALVMLIASANIAALVVARTTARRRELAIRETLGAGRWRVARQVFAESVLIAVIAGLAGLLLSAWLVDLLKVLGPSIPRGAHTPVNLRVFAFSLALGLGSALLFGLVPALRAPRGDLTSALRDDAGRPQPFRFRSLLVTAEVALTVVLLTGALLAARNFVGLLAVDLGFDTNRLLVLQVFPAFDKYPDQSRVAALYDRIVAELGAIPGVSAVGATSGGPMFGGPESIEFTVKGDPPAPPNASPVARYFNIGPGYFRALGVGFRAGRDFGPGDRESAAPVAIVNEALARRYFPGRSPIDQTLLVGGNECTIVGVTSDVRMSVDQGAGPNPEIYWPYHQRARWASYIVLRTEGEVAVASAVSAARARLGGIDRELDARNVETFDGMLARRARSPRFLMLLLGLFASLAMLLSLVGVYGLVSYVLAARTREFGIRISLGAQPSDVLRSALAGGAVSVLVGTAAGIALSAGAAKTLATLVPQLGPLDAGTLTAVSAVLLAAGLIASYSPARRALRIDPVCALRSE